MGFEEDKLLGVIAQRFIERYGKSLLFPQLSERILVYIKEFVPEEGYMSNWPDSVTAEESLAFKDKLEKTFESINLEGGDLYCLTLRIDHEVVLPEAGMVEVKRNSTVNAILYSRDSYPSIGFEIISKGTAEDGTPGWLLRWTNTTRSLEEQKTSEDKLRTIIPKVLVYCLYDSTKEDATPYAVVSFYDIPALLSCLLKIGKDRYGWNLRDWDVKPKTPEQRDRQRHEVGGSNGQLWSVSLKQLKAYRVPMYITTIGEKPALPDDGYLQYNQPRLDNFWKMADQHTTYEELEKMRMLIQNPKYDVDYERFIALTGMPKEAAAIIKQWQKKEQENE